MAQSGLIGQHCQSMRAVCTNLCKTFDSADTDSLPRSQQFLQQVKSLYATYSSITRDFTDESVRQSCHEQSLKIFSESPAAPKLLKLVAHLMQKHKSTFFAEAPHDSLVMTTLMSALHNFSDSSVDVVRMLAGSDDFCSGYYIFTLREWRLPYEQKKLSVDASKRIRQALDIVYNCFFKNDTETDTKLANYEFVEPAKPFLQAEDNRMSFSALLLVCFALDESHAEYYLGQQQNIRLLIKTLDLSIENDRRRCLGYHVIELAKCVNRLALNDVNKDLLVKLNLLPVLQRLLGGGKEDEMEMALKVLFTLSFSSAVQGRVKEEFKDKLGELLDDSRWAETEAFQGLLFNLGGDFKLSLGGSVTEKPRRNSKKKMERSKKSSESSAKARSRAKVVARGSGDEVETDEGSDGKGESKYDGDGGGGHVMISYQHECRAAIDEIKRRLAQRHGFKVWIDYEQMQDGSTLGAMADAVENASVVLMCMSKKYKESNNCRLEAEYAWRNNKKLIPLLMEFKYRPTGWLGLMLGTNLYYDFSGKYPFEPKFEELLRLIRKSMSGEAAEEPVVESKTSASSSSSTPAAPAAREHGFQSASVDRPLSGGGVASWDASKVKAWAREKKLHRCVSEARLTGRSLHQLLEMRRRSPEAFHASVGKYFRFKEFVDLASFLEALSELQS